MIAQHVPSARPALEAQLFIADRRRPDIVPASEPGPENEARGQRAEDGQDSHHRLLQADALVERETGRSISPRSRQVQGGL